MSSEASLVRIDLCLGFVFKVGCNVLLALSASVASYNFSVRINNSGCALKPACTSATEKLGSEPSDENQTPLSLVS